MQGESRSVDCVFCFFERVMPHVEEGSSIRPWRRLVLETLPHLRHQRWSQSKRGKFGCKWVTAFMAGNISRVQWRKVWHFVQMRDLGDYSLKYNKQHIWQIWFLKMSSELPHVLPPSSAHKLPIRDECSSLHHSNCEDCQKENGKFDKLCGRSTWEFPHAKQPWPTPCQWQVATFCQLWVCFCLLSQVPQPLLLVVYIGSWGTWRGCGQLTSQTSRNQPNADLFRI